MQALQREVDRLQLELEEAFSQAAQEELDHSDRSVELVLVNGSPSTENDNSQFQSHSVEGGLDSVGRWMQATRMWGGVWVGGQVGGWVGRCVGGLVCGWVWVGGWAGGWVGGWAGVWVGWCVGGCRWVGRWVGGCGWVSWCVGGCGWVSK